MTVVDKVIFLDIDGPMIPNAMILHYRMASFHRKFPVTTIACVNELCKRTGAKIVFNTYHNEPLKDVPDIGPALVEHGLDAGHIHHDDKTNYPGFRANRMRSIDDWLADHPEVKDWVAFDDELFTHDPKLIWIDPDIGLHVGHINQAIKQFGGKAVMTL